MIRSHFSRLLTLSTLLSLAIFASCTNKEELKELEVDKRTTEIVKNQAQPICVLVPKYIKASESILLIESAKKICVTNATEAEGLKKQISTDSLTIAKGEIDPLFAKQEEEKNEAGYVLTEWAVLESIATKLEISINDLNRNVIWTPGGYIYKLFLGNDYSDDLTQISSTKEIPEELSMLKHLAVINLENTLLEYKTFPVISSLEELDLTDAEGGLPENIGDLTNLIFLKFEDIQLTSVPESIGQLSNLEYLEIEDAQLSTIPESIGNLINLTYLDLGGNKLTSLPASFSNLKKLKTLLLDKNEFTTIPMEIAQMESLEIIELEQNKIEVIASDFFFPASLKELHFGYSNITDKGVLKDLSNSLDLLTNLVELDLMNNSLTELPSNLTALKSLKRLDLSYNNLASLSSSILELTSLESFTLRKNTLTELPSEIGNLKNLKFLELGQNDLLSLPESITELEALEELYFSSNKLTALPEKFNQLKNLKYLSGPSNQIKSLPTDLSGLDKLEAFNLALNDLQTIPESFFTNTALITLQLQDNDIEAIPSTVGNLVNLEYFRLSGNQLTKLPSEMKNLISLDRLELHENRDLEGVLSEIFGTYNFTITFSNTKLTRTPV